MQAGGHRFDPDRLHQFFGLSDHPGDGRPKTPDRKGGAHDTPEMKTRNSDGGFPLIGAEHLAPLFDIVNGFFNRCRGGIVIVLCTGSISSHNDNHFH